MLDHTQLLLNGAVLEDTDLDHLGNRGIAAAASDIRQGTGRQVDRSDQAIPLDIQCQSHVRRAALYCCGMLTPQVGILAKSAAAAFAFAAASASAALVALLLAAVASTTSVCLFVTSGAIDAACATVARASAL